MPSRKRSKGQARKAKAKASSQQAEERSCIWRHPPRRKCDHGLPRALPLGHNVCYRFKDTFHTAWNVALELKSPAQAAIHAMKEVTYQEFPDIWNDINDANREMIKAYFTCTGTNVLLGLHDEGDEDRQDQAAEVAGALAAAVLLLENYDPTEGFRVGAIAKTDKEFMRNKDIIEGCQRLLLRFFSKRTSCACLDKMYAEVKMSRPKTGLCDHCGQRKERSILMMCDGCKNQQYCSQQCQAADWSRHKVHCRSRRR